MVDSEAQADGNWATAADKNVEVLASLARRMRALLSPPSQLYLLPAPFRAQALHIVVQLHDKHGAPKHGNCHIAAREELARNNLMAGIIADKVVGSNGVKLNNLRIDLEVYFG